MSLETTITGKLLSGYKQLHPGTMLHADQLMSEYRENPGILRNFLFYDFEEEIESSFGAYTADGMIYHVDDSGNPVLAITRGADNPILRNIDDAFYQLINQHYYTPFKKDVQRALASPHTMLITLPELRLSNDKNEAYLHLNIGTAPAKYNQLNAEERKFAERIYGQGDDFVKNMEFLERKRITETKIWVFEPGFICVKEDPFMMASWLGNFDNHLRFNARFYQVNSSHYQVRGVCPRNVSAGHSAKKSRKKPVRRTGEPEAVLVPSVDEVLAYSASYVPEAAREQFEAGLRNLYKK